MLISREGAGVLYRAGKKLWRIRAPSLKCDILRSTAFWGLVLGIYGQVPVFKKGPLALAAPSNLVGAARKA